jgi:hypothetical protein
MKPEILNVVVAVLVTVIYLIGAMKIVLPLFKTITNPLSGATGVLLFGTILGFGITLNNFSGVATSALHFYAAQNNIAQGIGYWLLFALIAFVFSYIVFRLSFAMVGIASAENEKAELAKNNYTIAGLHVVVFNIVCLVVSQSLVDLANTLVQYPQFPN